MDRYTRIKTLWVIGRKIYMDLDNGMFDDDKEEYEKITNSMEKLRMIFTEEGVDGMNEDFFLSPLNQILDGSHLDGGWCEDDCEISYNPPQYKLDEWNRVEMEEV